MQAPFFNFMLAFNEKHFDDFDSTKGGISWSGVELIGVSIQRKVMSMAGFVILALSPSFVDWQQSPELRYQIVFYYVIALLLIWFGLFGRD